LRSGRQAATTRGDFFLAAIAATGLAMSGLGLLAPIVPPLELVNHFRPATFAGCLVAVALAWQMRRRRALVVLIALSCFNAGLLAIASTTGTSASISTGAYASTGRQLKLLTFNVFGANERLADAGRWILDQDADLVVLQEMTWRSKPQLLPLLQKRYAHIHDCRCNDIVIASKLRFSASGGEARTAAVPSWSWIEIDDGAAGKLRVVGLRPYYAYRPNEQAVQYQWIEKQLAGLIQPIILIGDFNLTPWSWKLTRLIHRTGLVRHGTWARSWPAQDNWPNIPAFLIDNVMTTPEIRSIAFATGPWLGSDHLPVVATIQLP